MLHAAILFLAWPGAGFVRFKVDKVKDLNTMTNGILAGLVSVTGGYLGLGTPATHNTLCIQSTT